MMRTHPTDLVMVHLFAVDQIQHYFWHYMDPAHPLHDPEGVRLLGDVIKEIYRTVDDLLGELLADLPPETSLVVLSDHGAGPLSSRWLISVNQFLASVGLLRFKDNHRPASRASAVAHFGLTHASGLLKRLLPSRLRTRLTWTFPEARDVVESYMATGQIDWTATKAYCMEKFGSSIWVNLKGVRPNGIVEPGTDYEELLAFITKKFYEIRDPETGAQIIDLAPTILHLMGVPVPDDMDGQVLTEALKDEYLIRYPVAYRTEDGVDGKRSGQL